MDLLSSNTKLVPEEAVRFVPEPEFTKTWHPVSHGKVLDALFETLTKREIGIQNTAYSLTRDGKNMFGVISVADSYDRQDRDLHPDGLTWTIGVRNSLKMNFAIGFCAGTHVFVCDNLCFSGSFIEFRRHTAGLDTTELLEMTDRVVDQVQVEAKQTIDWQQKLAGYILKEDYVKILAYDSICKGAFAASKFSLFLECFEEEGIADPGNKDTIHQFHGGVTRTLRNNSLFMMEKRSTALRTVINDFISRDKVRGGSFFSRVLKLRGRK